MSNDIVPTKPVYKELQREKALKILENLRSRRPQILNEAQRLTRQIEQLKLTPEQVMRLVSKSKGVDK